MDAGEFGWWSDHNNVQLEEIRQPVLDVKSEGSLPRACRGSDKEREQLRRVVSAYLELCEGRSTTFDTLTWRPSPCYRAA